MRRAFLGLPTYKTVPSASMPYHLRLAFENVSKGLLTSFCCSADLFITNARNDIVVSCLAAYHNGDCTDLWFVDDDMKVEEGTLERLLSHRLPVVSALCRTAEGLPASFASLSPLTRVSEELISLSKKDGKPLSVAGVGMACCLIDCQILETMQRDLLGGAPAWFMITEEIDYDRKKVFRVGEDISFCRHLAEMDVPIYLDTGLVCGHR